jgi:CRISPR-associated protein Csb2
MAFLGAPYADGRLFGLALAPPGGKNGGLLRDGDFQRAIKAIAPLTPDDAGQERRVLTLDGLGLRLALVGETDRASLDPGRYAGPARTWATATPIALDRHLKEKGSEARQTEIEAVIAQACVNIGLPAPTKVTADKHSAVEGAPSAYPSGRAPAWTGWRVPKTLESRALTHAVIQFDERVAGPVILGAGRFCGLGLCLPLDADRRR